KRRIPRKWRAVRRGCSYARMRSDATSPRTPSARPVFPSPSCCSATRSISVAATPPPFSNLPMMNRKHLTSARASSLTTTATLSKRFSPWGLLVLLYPRRRPPCAPRRPRVRVRREGHRWAGTATTPRSGAVALDSPRESTQPERHDVHVHDHLVHGADRR